MDERKVVDEEISYLFLDRILSEWKISKDLSAQIVNAASLGFQIEYIAVQGRRLVDTLMEYVNQHNPQLIVIGTHGRTALNQLLERSYAETLFRRISTPSLFISPRARGFVHPTSGEVKFRRVLIPVDHAPAPEQAIHAAREFGRLLIGEEPRIQFVHIGHTEKIVDVRVIEPRFILRPGYDPVKGIMGVAAELIPDLICMTTAGHQGLLDALRGSTTQRVLRAAPCPVLTITAEE